jgi:glutamine synthetase
MDAAQLSVWLDEHSITSVRTEGISLDGLVIGKHLSRAKFERSLPLGPAITDFALALDIGGSPQLGWWADWRQAALGDIHQCPDLATLVASPDRPGRADVLVDLVRIDGTPIPICPRGLLTRVVERLAGHGLTAHAAYELEFFVFQGTYDAARRTKYQHLVPAGAPVATAYSTHNAYRVSAFMDEVVRRLDGLGIAWEAWNDEAAPGQIELNLEPAAALTAADRTLRAKQVLKEVALDQGLSVTFMAKPTSEFGSGMHIHHSIRRDDEPAFFDGDTASCRSAVMDQWIAGLIATMPGAVSLLAPTINSYRRMVEFAAVPTTPTWGDENKSTGLRVVSRTPKLARIEHRVASADVNVYVALATILAGGLAGFEAELELPAEYEGLAWGLPPDSPRLPASISTAADALAGDKVLASILGEDFVDWWINTRRWEWLMFNTGGGDATARTVTDWELNRYFELV